MTASEHYTITCMDNVNGNQVMFGLPGEHLRLLTHFLLLQVSSTIMQLECSGYIFCKLPIVSPQIIHENTVGLFQMAQI